jgi:hypothetical protein
MKETKRNQTGEYRKKKLTKTNRKETIRNQLEIYKIKETKMKKKKYIYEKRIRNTKPDIETPIYQEKTKETSKEKKRKKEYRKEKI